MRNTGRKFDDKLPARLFLALLAVLFLVAGIAKGEPLVVLQKAVRVCLECIGIG